MNKEFNIIKIVLAKKIINNNWLAGQLVKDSKITRI